MLYKVCLKSPFRLKVRTLPFQGNDTGSNPVEDKIYNLKKAYT